MSTSEESSALLSPHGPLRTPPRDKGHFVYWSFILLGIATLLPWNSFITISDYYRFKFAGSSYSDNFQNYFAVGFTSVNIIALCYALKNQYKANLSLRILGSFFLTILVFSACLISVKTDIDPTVYFQMTFGMILLTGICSALSNNGVFGTAAQLPPAYMQAVSLGNAIAGVAVSLAQILSIVLASAAKSDPESLNQSAFYYFLNTVLVISLSFFIFLFMQKHPFYLHYVSGSAAESVVVYNSVSRSVSMGSVYINCMTGSVMDSPPALSDASEANSDESHLVTSPQRETEQPEGALSSTFLEIGWYILAMFILFATTLSLFPALTSSIQSTTTSPDDHSLFSLLFVPIHFLLFNGGDYLGRMLASVEWLQPKGGKTLAALSVGRFLFYPLLLSCNVIVRDAELHELPRLLPLIFSEDWMFWIVMGLFSVSHGWICSLILMAAPQTCSKQTKEFAGTLLVSCLSLGMACGSLLSFGLRAILCGCNPFLS